MYPERLTVGSVGFVGSCCYLVSRHGKAFDQFVCLVGQVTLTVISALEAGVQTAMSFTSDLDEAS